MAEEEKKKKKFKKSYLIIGGVAVFVILLIVSNVDTARKEKAKQEALMNQGTDSMTESMVDGTGYVDTTPVETQAQLSEMELEQLRLNEEYGEPPQGFRWNEYGELIAVGDETLTAEEVCWRYLQAVSNKDFVTAQKYAFNGSCIATYNSFYEDMYDSAINRLTKTVYSSALGSLELLESKQNGVFPNGRFIYTFKADVIDLSNKTFWEDDKEEIFSKIEEYSREEEDKLKAMEYVFNLISSYYESGEALKRTVTFDIVVDKVTNGGYLVADDSALDSICSYNEGTSVYEYIMSKYDEWYNEKTYN